MAYVGTAKFTGNGLDTLTRTVLGEAGNQGYYGQLAVADVIENRGALGAGNGFSMNGYQGAGADVQAATSSNQFQGFDFHTSSDSPAYAQAQSAVLDAQSGHDVTGGATFYANPGASSAGWATRLNDNNSLQIGDHYFTDNTNGTPFSGGDASPPSDSSFDGGATGGVGAEQANYGSSSQNVGPYDFGSGTQTGSGYGGSDLSFSDGISPGADQGNYGTSSQNIGSYDFGSGTQTDGSYFGGVPQDQMLPGYGASGTGLGDQFSNASSYGSGTGSQGGPLGGLDTSIAGGDNNNAFGGLGNSSANNNGGFDSIDGTGFAGQTPDATGGSTADASARPLTIQGNGQTGSQSSGSSGSTDSMLNPASVPVAITTSQAADDATSKANTSSLTSNLTQDTNTLTGTLKSTYAAAHSALGDTLFRVGLVVIGAILLAGGLWIIAAGESDGGIKEALKGLGEKGAGLVAA